MMGKRKDKGEVGRSWGAGRGGHRGIPSWPRCGRRGWPQPAAWVEPIIHRQPLGAMKLRAKGGANRGQVMAMVLLLLSVCFITTVSKLHLP